MKIEKRNSVIRNFMFLLFLSVFTLVLNIKIVQAQEPNVKKQTSTGTPASDANPVYSMNVSNKTLYVGQTTKLQINVVPDSTEIPRVAWKSNNKLVATVDKKGNVKAIKSGTAIITATVNQIKLSCKIIVKNVTNTTNLIPLYNEMDDCQIVKNKEMKYIVTDDVLNQDYDTYSFTISKKSTITIDLESVADVETPSDLTVHIMRGDFDDSIFADYDIFFPYKSKVTNTITLEKGKYIVWIENDLTSGEIENQFRYQLKVIHTTSNTENVKFETNKQTVYIGSSYHLLLLNNYNIAVFNSKITWKSSKTSVATVNQSGKVEAISKGDCIITATLPDGKKLSCKITVPKPSLERQLYSKTTYAFVASITDETIYNDCMISVYNRSSTKDIKHIEFEILQYDSKGQFLESPYKMYYSDDTLATNSEGSYTFWVNDNASKARVCIKNVTFDDGSIWNNPVYKIWHNEYYGKKYQ